MTFSEFKTALRNYEENEKSCNPLDNQDNVMFSKQRFTGKCFKCDKQGKESSECRMKTEKWCVKCRSKTHNTKDCRANKKVFEVLRAVAAVRALIVWSVVVSFSPFRSNVNSV